MTSRDSFDATTATAILGVDTLWGGDVLDPSGAGRFIADSWFSDEPLPIAYTHPAAARLRTSGGVAGKEIDLQMDGEDTELDKIMIEDLADPLMHLIRNAIDHGIESPDARAALGKPEKGRVRLSAAPQGNHVVIGPGLPHRGPPALESGGTGPGRVRRGRPHPPGHRVRGPGALPPLGHGTAVLVCHEVCPVSPKAIFVRTTFETIRDGQELSARVLRKGVDLYAPLPQGVNLASGDYYLRVSGQPGATLRRITGVSGNRLTLEDPLAVDGIQVFFVAKVDLLVKLTRPFVDPAKRIGCGMCEHDCPVAGLRAIRVYCENDSRSRPGRMLI